VSITDFADSHLGSRTVWKHCEAEVARISINRPFINQLQSLVHHVRHFLVLSRVDHAKSTWRPHEIVSSTALLNGFISR
jgi:hypothetical protein